MTPELFSPLTRCSFPLDPSLISDAAEGCAQKGYPDIWGLVLNAERVKGYEKETMKIVEKALLNPINITKRKGGEFLNPRIFDGLEPFFLPYFNPLSTFFNKTVNPSKTYSYLKKMFKDSNCGALQFALTTNVVKGMQTAGLMRWLPRLLNKEKIMELLFPQLAPSKDWHGRFLEVEELCKKEQERFFRALKELKECNQPVSESVSNTELTEEESNALDGKNEREPSSKGSTRNIHWSYWGLSMAITSVVSFALGFASSLVFRPCRSEGSDRNIEGELNVLNCPPGSRRLVLSNFFLSVSPYCV